MKSVLVECSCCRGTGKTKLSPELQRTLDVVPANRFASTQEIQAKVNDEFVGQTAINNRLRLHLLSRGLVVSERRGKALYWKRVK